MPIDGDDDDYPFVGWFWIPELPRHDRPHWFWTERYSSDNEQEKLGAAQQDDSSDESESEDEMVKAEMKLRDEARRERRREEESAADRLGREIVPVPPARQPIVAVAIQDPVHAIADDIKVVDPVQAGAHPNPIIIIDDSPEDDGDDEAEYAKEEGSKNGDISSSSDNKHRKVGGGTPANSKPSRRRIDLDQDDKVPERDDEQARTGRSFAKLPKRTGTNRIMGRRGSKDEGDWNFEWNINDGDLSGKGKEKKRKTSDLDVSDDDDDSEQPPSSQHSSSTSSSSSTDASGSKVVIPQRPWKKQKIATRNNSDLNNRKEGLSGGVRGKKQPSNQQGMATGAGGSQRDGIGGYSIPGPSNKGMKPSPPASSSSSAINSVSPAAIGATASRKPSQNPNPSPFTGTASSSSSVDHRKWNTKLIGQLNLEKKSMSPKELREIEMAIPPKGARLQRAKWHATGWELEFPCDGCVKAGTRCVTRDGSECGACYGRKTRGGQIICNIRSKMIEGENGKRDAEEQAAMRARYGVKT